MCIFFAFATKTCYSKLRIRLLEISENFLYCRRKNSMFPSSTQLSSFYAFFYSVFDLCSPMCTFFRMKKCTLVKIITSIYRERISVYYFLYTRVGSPSYFFVCYFCLGSFKGHCENVYVRIKYVAKHFLRE